MLRKIFALVAVLHFYYGIYYDMNHVKFPPEFMRGGFFDSIGRFKYLTFWNMIVQATYFTICVINDSLGNSEQDPRSKPLIRKVKDFMYPSIAFPVAMFVGVTFWILMFIDRELVLPKALDPFFPTWLNHMMHTNIMLFTLLEMFLTFHPYPPRSKGLSGLLVFMLIYLIWVHIIHAWSDVWVYPVLDVLNFGQRIIFFAASLGLVIALYFLGEHLNKLIWRREETQSDRVRGRAKSK